MNLSSPLTVPYNRTFNMEQSTANSNSFKIPCALNNDKFLYENKYKAFDIHVYNRETEIRSSVLVKCPMFYDFKELFFFFVSVFKFIVHVLTTL